MQAPAWARPVGNARYVRTDEGTGFGRLAGGTFGNVYPALDALAKKLVAVKRQTFPSDAASRELALYGLLSCPQYAHKRLQTALDIFYYASKVYIVFELQPRTVWSRFHADEGPSFGLGTS